jgi:hypothetical protein
MAIRWGPKMTQTLKHPLTWRLADVEGTGVEFVNVVMPEQGATSNKEILLSTDIPSPLNSSMDISWSDEDLDLFQTLLYKMLDVTDTDADRLELNQPELVDVLHIVAAAHFIEPMDADEFLAQDILTVISEIDLGDLVCVNTKGGFKTAVVADLDSIEAVCVLLEPLEIDGEDVLDIYDTFVVNKHNILPPEFGNVLPGNEAIIH